MEDYIQRLKKLQTRIEILSNEIMVLKLQDDTNSKKLLKYDKKVDKKIKPLEDEIKYLENKRKEFNIKNVDLKEKKKRMFKTLGVCSISLLIFFISTFASFEDISQILQEIMIVPSTIFSIVSMVSGLLSISDFISVIKIKKKIKGIDLKSLNVSLENKKNELCMVRKNLEPLIEKKDEIKFLIDYNGDLIREMSIEKRKLEREEKTISDLLISSIVEEVTDSYHSELEGQMMMSDFDIRNIEGKKLIRQRGCN